MNSKYIAVLALCAMPVLAFSQYWRNTVTATYQQRTKALATPEPPIYSLDLPATLPVVFHIVHPRTAGSAVPTREDVEWQVAQLNRHFSLEEFQEKQSRYGAHEYDGLAADTEIRFCLSDVLYHPSDSTAFSAFNTIKADGILGASPLVPREYINVWIGNLGGSSGFAQQPGGIWDTDGIVIDADFFGPRPIPYNEGKTLTHLMGNYLGLKDIWGEAYCEDDGISDTPIHNSPNYNHVAPGENHISLCPGFKREMYMNYMDNTVDSLLYMFTEGQKKKMHDFLRNERNHLLVGCRTRPQIRLADDAPPLVPGMHVYPNPTYDVINIALRDMAGEAVTLRIHNMVGELVHEERIDPSLTKTISIKDWNAGIYVVSASGIQLYSVKFVKQ